jgi:hypothetical protein
MGKLVAIAAATAAIIFTGFYAGSAEAEAWRGASSIRGFTPIEKAGCLSKGPHCAKGYRWRCGFGARFCWCGPC